jgi:4a-hydroxytetrahydrobiopterin dehydratase
MQKDDLKQHHCVPCEGGTAPLTESQENDYYSATPSWELNREKTPHRLHKLFKFKDFKEAMIFVNRVAALAEEEGHHPNFSISYNKVELELFTHAINGLSENDFIMAVKIDELT